MHERRDGLREGLARGLSQACVYCLEAQKTVLQIHGRMQSVPTKKFFDMMTKGMLTSATTSGIVFGSYFTVYHTIGANQVWAGPISAFTTSFIKIPISNSMRLLQAGLAKNVFDAGHKIVRAHRVRGLYRGYSASLLEDMIEFDLRTRMYNNIRGRLQGKDAHPQFGMVMGGLVGMAVAWLTTPFDTIRAHMAVEATKAKKTHNVLRTAQNLWKSGGIPALYRGAMIRALSNAVKSALFYMFFESLTLV